MVRSNRFLCVKLICYVIIIFVPHQAQDVEFWLLFSYVLTHSVLSCNCSCPMGIGVLFCFVLFCRFVCLFVCLFVGNFRNNG